MEVLKNLVYEIGRGTKPLALFTCEKAKHQQVLHALKLSGLDYFINEIGSKINVFLGKKDCVELAKLKFNKCLSRLSPEEDFILGTLLGYDRVAQASRYLQKNCQFG